MPETSSPNTRRLLMLILAISVVARLVAALFLGNEVLPSPGAYDQISYNRLAQRIVDGHGMTSPIQWWPMTQPDAPTAHWSFLYTYALAGVYAVFGQAPLLARLLQAIAVGLLLPLATYGLARRVFDERVALWSAGLSAIYIYFVYYSAALMTEMFTIVAVLWMLQQVVRLQEGPADRRAWILLGLSIGIAGLLRQVALLPVPFLCPLSRPGPRFRGLGARAGVPKSQSRRGKSRWTIVGERRLWGAERTLRSQGRSIGRVQCLAAKS
jgi:hypothetical protein